MVDISYPTCEFTDTKVVFSAKFHRLRVCIVYRLSSLRDDRSRALNKNTNQDVRQMPGSLTAWTILWLTLLCELFFVWLCLRTNELIKQTRRGLDTRRSVTFITGWALSVAADWLRSADNEEHFFCILLLWPGFSQFTSGEYQDSQLPHEARGQWPHEPTCWGQFL